MSTTKAHHYKVVGVEVSSQKNPASVSSFLATSGFQSSRYPTSQICRGAEPKAEESIFFECDEEKKMWYKLTRVYNGQQVQIEAGSHYNIKEESGRHITFEAQGTKIKPSTWIIQCLAKEKATAIPAATAPSSSPSPQPDPPAGPPANPPATPTSRTLARVKVSSIRPFEGQPRHYFDEVSLNELKEGILEIGVLQPLVVRRLRPEEKQEEENYEYELVDGERRWRAIQLAKLEEVEVLIEERSLTPALQFAMSFAMNHNKEEHTLGEVVEGLVRMTAEGYTQLQITKVLCKSTSWVNQHLSLRHLHHDLKALLDPPIPEEKRLRFADARYLVKVQDANAQLEIYTKACEESKNQKMVSHHIKQGVDGHKDRKKSGSKRDNVRSLSRFNEAVDASLVPMEKVVKDIADFLRLYRSESYKDSLIGQLRKHAIRFNKLAEEIDDYYNNPSRENGILTHSRGNGSVSPPSLVSI